MRIAVCDDDKNDLAGIREFFSRYDAGLFCDGYHSAVDLLEAMKKEHYDLVFLDIEMLPMNGFDAARRIAKKSDKPLIIFVTNSSKYTIQGYEVAFRYLIKPISYEQFSTVLKAAFEQIVPKKILVEINGKNLLISTKDIYYFEVLDHFVRIRTHDNCYDYRNSLKNIEQMLGGGHFVRPHNSFLVNLEHVVSATQSEFIMSDNRKISISRKRKVVIFKALHRFLRR